jgi:hypothetical protein
LLAEQRLVMATAGVYKFQAHSVMALTSPAGALTLLEVPVLETALAAKLISMLGTILTHQQRDQQMVDESDLELVQLLEHPQAAAAQ